MKRVVIGLGDSWTRGVGAVSMDTYRRYGGKVDKVTGEEERDILYPQEIKNSWVSRLAEKLGYEESHNYGIRGGGNYGTLMNMMINADQLEFDSGILVYILSSPTRKDFLIEKDPTGISYEGRDEHGIFTVSPVKRKKSEIDVWHKELENFLFTHMYLPETALIETLMHIVHAQNFAKQNNLKFLFGNAFSWDLSDIKELQKYPVAKLIDWNNNIHAHLKYKSLFELIGHSEKGSFNWEDWHDYEAMKLPGEYVTNCVHPTIKGQDLIAETILRVINNMGYNE